MIRTAKVGGFIGAAILIIGCFLKWITVEQHDIIVTGVNAAKTNFGRPGYLHLILVVCFLYLHVKPNLWAKRANLAVIAINFAWAVRNYLIITQCRGGECPSKHAGIYLVVAGSLLMLIAGLFPSTSLASVSPRQAGNEQ